MDGKVQSVPAVPIDGTQGGSERPPSSPPVRLSQPELPVDALKRQRKETLRFKAAVERISVGEPIEASVIEAMRTDVESTESVNKELAEVIHRQNRLIATLMSALRSTSDGIIACDLMGRVTMFNPGAEAIFQLEESEYGYDPETSNALGDNLFRLVGEFLYRGDTGSSPDIGLLDRLKENGTVRNHRIVFKGSRGRITHTLFSLDYIRDLGGKATGLIATIKDNSEVEKLTQVDPLTGLYNRRYFDVKICEVHGLIQRGHYESGSASVVFLDVDHFGEFNKKFGHQIGDEVLKTVAETLRREVRVIDTVARYGGEEFVIILPSVDRMGAAVFAERLRKAIAQTKVPTATHGELSVTASIGIATHYDGCGSVETFIEQANLAMLEAKCRGRNQVHAFVA